MVKRLERRLRSCEKIRNRSFSRRAAQASVAALSHWSAVFGCLFLACWVAAAQYPPGQIPPGQYPPGQAPLPGQHPVGQEGAEIPRPSKHKKGQKSQEATIKQPIIEADGVTVSNDGKKLVVHTEDGRWLTLTLNPETKWTRGETDIETGKIVPRTTVHVTAAEDDEAFLTAVQVNLLKDVPVDAPAAASGLGSTSGSTAVSDDDLTRPTILHDSVDAPDRPILRRGKPKNAGTHEDAQAKAETPKKESSEDFTISDDKPVSAKRGGPGAELLDRTTEWASTFTRGLPNFVCQQFTTRYTEVSRSEGWQAQDVVTAKVIYEDGREKYQDITVGGKKTNKSMMDLGGSTSTGEFASMLSSIFDPVRETDFKFSRSTTLNRESAAIFDFSVVLPRSDWTIIVGGQTLRPAYTGTVWVDKGSAQVRHIDLQAQNVPKDFPFDTIESTIDYDEVSFGTVKFLVPTHAENLSCQRGSSFCNKNTIDFRDYHKYSGESTVTFK